MRRRFDIFWGFKRRSKQTKTGHWKKKRLKMRKDFGRVRKLRRRYKILTCHPALPHSFVFRTYLPKLRSEEATVILLRANQNK
uniref:Ribosomal protein L18 n=1 Tax=Mesocestoides corti TaxID=53468 RepID=A0A5K3FF09_MESCO